jgi:hypothetical protein
VTGGEVVIAIRILIVISFHSTTGQSARQEVEQGGD